MLALALQPVDTTPFSQGICHMIIKLPAQKICFSEKEPDFRDLIIRSIDPYKKSILFLQRAYKKYDLVMVKYVSWLMVPCLYIFYFLLLGWGRSDPSDAKASVFPSKMGKGKVVPLPQRATPCSRCCLTSQRVLRTNLQLRKLKIDTYAENLVCFTFDGTSGSLFYKHLTKFHPVYGHYLEMAKKFLTAVFVQSNIFRASKGEVVWIISDDCTISHHIIKILHDVRIPFLAHSIEKKSRSVSVLVPNFHFIEKVGYKQMQDRIRKVSLATKKKPLVFWRGSTTGVPCSVPSLFGRNCSHKCEEVQRVELVRRSSEIPWIDAKLSNFVQWCKGKEFEHRNLLGKNKPESFWINYRGVIEIDGNVDAWGNRWRMVSGSVIFRVESPYISSFTEHQIPHEHFIPIAANFSNLKSSTKIITSTVPADTQKLKDIAKNAYEYGSKYTYSYEVQKVAQEIFSIWGESFALFS